MTPLGHLADVFTGTTFRGRDATRAVPGGSCRLIQISDLSDEGRLVTEELHPIEPGEAIKKNRFLRQGDILFPNRGTRNTACVFDLPDPRVLVGGQFFVIRLHAGSVLPAFVAWYLRSEPASRYFQVRRKGTLVQNLQRSDLAEIEIPLPSLAKQDAIVALDALAEEERQLAKALAGKRFELLQGRLNSGANHST